MGFGLKATSLKDVRISALLESADSMAWSFAARREGRGRNDWREAAAMAGRMAALSKQLGAAWANLRGDLSLPHQIGAGRMYFMAAM
jgi:hypothetical protein